MDKDIKYIIRSFIFLSMLLLLGILIILLIIYYDFYNSEFYKNIISKINDSVSLIHNQTLYKINVSKINNSVSLYNHTLLQKDIFHISAYCAFSLLFSYVTTWNPTCSLLLTYEKDHDE